MEENNYGWICPKCGCPNSPTNKTCAACFMPVDAPLPYSVMQEQCPKCGIKFSTAMGFVCVNTDCPCGFGPVMCGASDKLTGITSFNPLNAIDNLRKG